jgi:hypothetical protein
MNNIWFILNAMLLYGEQKNIHKRSKMAAFFKQNESKKYKDFQERFVFLPNTKGLSSSWGGGFSFDVNDKYYELNSDQETYTNFMYVAVL